MKKSKRHMAVVLALMSLFQAVALSSCQSEPKVEKERIEGYACFPGLDVTALSTAAEYIVYGTVKQKNDVYIIEHPDEDGLKDPFLEVFTPYTIEIIEDIKGTCNSSTVEYLSYGGETEDAIYVTLDNTEVSVGDEVLLFLDENGISWGSQSIYPVTDGTLNAFTRMLPDDAVTLSDDEEETPSRIEVSVDDFITLIQQELENQSEEE